MFQLKLWFSSDKCFAALLQSEGTCKLPALVRLHGFTPPGGQALELQFQNSWSHSNRELMPVVESTARVSFEEALQTEALSCCTQQQEQNPGSAPPGILHVIPLSSPSQHVSSDRLLLLE